MELEINEFEIKIEKEKLYDVTFTCEHEGVSYRYTLPLAKRLSKMNKADKENIMESVTNHFECVINRRYNER